MHLQMVAQVPQDRQDTVTGYIRLFIHMTTPCSIIQMCIVYYGTHCPCTNCWNVNDKHKTQTICNLPELVHGCFSNNLASQYECTRQFRMLLSQANNPPILETLASDVVPRFLEFSGNNKLPELQYESIWALLNITSGPEQCIAYVIKIDAHIIFIDLLQSQLYEIQEQTLWALGNIAADDPNLLLKHNILNKILPICNSTFDEKYVTNFNNSNIIRTTPIWEYVNLLSTCAWTLSNLCRTPPLELAYINELIECLHCLYNNAIVHMVNMSTDVDIRLSNGESFIGKKDEILQHIAWAFSFLTQSEEFNTEITNKMNEFGIIEQFISLMDHTNGKVRRGILQLMGNILTDCHEDVRERILYKYKCVLELDNVCCAEQKDICWSLSNVCATDNDKDKMLMLELGLFKILIQYLKEKNYAIAKKALLAIANATTKCNKLEIMKHMVENNVSNALMTFLIKCKYEENYKKTDEILLAALKCVENMLIFDDGNVCNALQQSGIVDLLEDQQANEQNINNNVYEKCVDIIKKYFRGNDNNNQNNNQ